MSRISRREFLRATSLVAAGAIVAACQPTAAPQDPGAPSAPQMPTAAPPPTAVPATGPVAPASGRPAEITFIGAPITTLDSYLYTAGMYTQVYAGLSEGLVYFGKDLSTVVCQAESWFVTDDGLEYTFNLRKDNVWYDGSPVTAGDYVTAIIYQTTPGQESKYGWDSPFGSLIGAGDYRAGAAPAEAVGAEAVDDFTLKLRLVRPRPDFVNALVTGSCYPLQTAAWERYGADWVKPENFQGNGPYMIEDWVLDQYITLAANPSYNLDRGNLEKVTIRFAGQPLEAYEAEEVDVAGIGTVAALVVAQSDATLSEQLSAIDTSGLEWLAPLKSEDGFLYDNPVVIKAIAKAIDIPSIINPIWLGIKRATGQMSYPIQPGYDPKYDIQVNVEEARQMLADAGFPNGQGIPQLKLTFPSYQNEDYISTWTAISAMVKDSLGIDLVLNNLETGIYSQVAYDPLNPADEAGLCFFASGKPWKDPLFGFEFAGQLNQFADSATYSQYGTLVKEISQVRQGLKQIPGNTDADFGQLVSEVEALRTETLALYDEKGYPQTIIEDVTKTFDGWVDSAKKAAEAAGTGDRAKAWQDANAVLWEAKTRNYLIDNRRDVFVDIENWRLEALSTTDEGKQIALAQQAFEVVVEDGFHMPLWVAQSVYLMRPYVSDFYRNPFWWGNPMYLKWVNIV